VIKMIYLNKNLSTRHLAQSLFKKILDSKDFILNFSNVEIISRSFANEFVNLEKKNNIKIEKLNLSLESKYIFDIADKPLDNDILSKNKFSTTSVQKYANLI
jgi:hypothetical protein